MSQLEVQRLGMDSSAIAAVSDGRKNASRKSDSAVTTLQEWYEAAVVLRIRMITAADPTSRAVVLVKAMLVDGRNQEGLFKPGKLRCG